MSEIELTKKLEQLKQCESNLESAKKWYLQEMKTRGDLISEIQKIKIKIQDEKTKTSV